MKKLDWYIAKKFISTFLYAILILTIITVVVDASEKTDDFHKSGLSFMQIVQQYYFGFIPHMVALLFPLFVFISVIFFTSKMAGRSEVIAILASGTSFGRMLRPYMICAGLLSFTLWLGFRYVLPRANEIFSIFQVKYVDGPNYHTTSNNTIYFRVDSNRYASLSNYDIGTRSGYGFVLNKVENHHLIYNMRAERLEWDTAKKGQWKLVSAIERFIGPKGETIKQHDNLYMAFNFKPHDIKKDEYTKDKLTTPELDHFIDLQQARGAEGMNDLLVERYKRTATPLAIVLLTFIGVSVSSRKVRGGMGLHLATGFIAAVIFIFIDRFSTMFSTKGNLSPMLAAWLPNLIFIFVAIYLYRQAPK